jgi:hypothetical protein
MKVFGQTIVPFITTSPFEGIIHSIKGSDPENVHYRGLVNVTSNATASGRESRPQNVVDFQSNAHFLSRSQWQSSICFDFKPRRLKITHYSIRSFDRPQGSDHLRSWILQGFHDSRSWTTLDERSEDNQLNVSLLVATFPVTISAFYRYIQRREPCQVVCSSPLRIGAIRCSPGFIGLNPQ